MQLHFAAPIQCAGKFMVPINVARAISSQIKNDGHWQKQRDLNRVCQPKCVLRVMYRSKDMEINELICRFASE